MIKMNIQAIRPIPTTCLFCKAFSSAGVVWGRSILFNLPAIITVSFKPLRTFSAVLGIALLIPHSLRGAEIADSAAKGYLNLRTHPYLPPDFDDDVVDTLWKVWPEPQRSEAAAAEPANRRKQTFSYYGIISDPGDPSGRKPLGYVVDEKGNWTMTCLACHGGKVAGVPFAGLPNSHIALQTLTDDVRVTKLQLGKPLSHLDLGSIQMPLNTTDGTTNSVIFGIALGAFRNPDMTVDLTRSMPHLMHHDVDAPPFWNVRKKRSLYADGFSPKTARPLMQFILLPRVSPQQLTEWEPEFEEILAWIESISPPKYPFPIDQKLARTGESVFNLHCAQCHGKYGTEPRYDQPTIPLEEIGTDTLRLQALTPEHRTWMKRGWLSRFGADPVETDPVGYVAPPLDGVWASAPYFHNGSVPTLWHVLNSDSRPQVWKRTEDGYDSDRVGLEFTAYEKIPASDQLPSRRRRYFNTELPGKGNGGHRFPDRLNPEEKQAVLEYLKTL